MHSPLSFFIFCDENSLLCGFDSRDISYSFEVFKNSLDVHLPFHSFLSLMHLFMHLLTSFSLCFSSLGVFLLSSMSLRISAYLIDKSSITFAAADVVTRASVLLFLISLVLLLEWNTIEPASSPWCGNRAPSCSSALRSGCSSSFSAFVGHVSSSFFFPSIAAATAAACVGCGRPTRPDACAQSELKHPVVLSSCYCSSCFFLRFLVLLLHQVCDLFLLLLQMPSRVFHYCLFLFRSCCCWHETR